MISSQVYCTDSTKMGTKRVFSFQQNFIFVKYQSSKIDIILRQILNLVGFCYVYANANFQVM